MIKEAKGINDGTLITMSEFEKYIKEVIRRYKKLGLMSDLGLTFIQMILLKLFYL